MRVFHVALVALVGAGWSAGMAAAAPPDIWKNTPVNATAVTARSIAIDAAVMQLPALARPAADFQKMLLQIRAGAEVPAWRGQMDRFAQNAGGDSVTAALRELAKYWEARLEAREIDRALRKFYRTNVRFPDQLEEVKADIPEALRSDPWGEPWVYKPTAPQGFAMQDRQRYELGPKRFPHLSSLEGAAKAEPKPRDWKIGLREAGGAKALEIRTADGQMAVVQPGARVGEVTLAYIGDGWALFADTEGLFTVGY